jgi:membrane protein DedA with SNARE-associated domain
MTAAALPGLLGTIAPYLDRYGYGAVGALLLVEDFGVPVPGEAVMIAASVYAGTGRLNIAVVAAVAFVAAMTGDCIGWVIGRHGGHRLLARFGRYVLLPPQRLARAEAFFARHGGKIVIVARFFDVLRQANGIIAGMTGMRFPRFLALNAIGAALWVGVWTAVGDLAGHRIDALYPAITRYGGYELTALAALAAVLLAGAAARHFIRSRAGPEDPHSSGVSRAARRKRDRAALHRDLRLPGRLRDRPFPNRTAGRKPPWIRSTT